MTCIAGFVDHEKENVWIGADSAAVAGHRTLTRYAEPKVFRNGEFLIAYMGSFRFGHVLQHAFTPPKHLKKKSPIAYMITDFADAVREAMSEAGALRKKDDVVTLDGAALIGYRGNLFVLHTDFQVGSPMEGYAALGSGEDVANGALRVLRNANGIKPHERLTAVLEAAAAHVSTVCGPFRILPLNPVKEDEKEGA